MAMLRQSFSCLKLRAAASSLQMTDIKGKIDDPSNNPRSHISARVYSTGSSSIDCLDSCKSSQILLSLLEFSYYACFQIYILFPEIDSVIHQTRTGSCVDFYLWGKQDQSIDHLIWYVSLYERLLLLVHSRCYLYAHQPFINHLH